MTAQELKTIFSRFQNLNLLRLMDDLQTGNFTSSRWFDLRTKNMCPLAHGWDTLRHYDFEKDDNPVTDSRFVACGLVWDPHTPRSDFLGTIFVSWWDSGWLYSDSGARAAELLEVLREIWRERLEDADAVQRIVDHRNAFEVHQDGDCDQACAHCFAGGEA